MNNLRGRHLPSPASLWNSIEVNRRASVLAMLYDGGNGEPHCLLTRRSSQISYGSDPSLPGGKADGCQETSLEVARRESFEEIGLPVGLGLRHVRTMPAYLSSRFLFVVPEVVWLDQPNLDLRTGLPAVLDPSCFSLEVNSAFSVPLAIFLSAKNYRGDATNWSGLRFIQHHFSVAVREKKVGDPARHDIWGLTANIMVDIARLWYGREPEFEHRQRHQVGDQELIERLAELGYFAGERPAAINFRKVLGRESPLLDIRRVK